MLFGMTWLDLLLIALLVSFLVQGHRRGLWVVTGVLAGFAAGAVAAFYAIPLVTEAVADPMWRVAAVVATTVALLSLGQWIGSSIGRAIRLHVGLPALRRVDRWLGGLASVVVAALLFGLVALSLGGLGSPAITREIARSQVLALIDRTTPSSVQAWAARTRSAVTDLDVLPEMRLPPPASPGGATVQAAPAPPPVPVQEPAPAPAPAPESAPAPSSDPAPMPPLSSAPVPVPEPSLAPVQEPAPAPVSETEPSPTLPPEQAAVRMASDPSEAVVRVSSTAEQCGQVQSGTGVAVAPDRVLTNAHVVAGVETPMVQDAERGVHTARLVALDTARDLAVLAVDGADLPVLPLGPELTRGAQAEAMGFPDAGPFAVAPATVDAVGEVPLRDVLGEAVHAVDVYTLNTDIRQGYSGGPVVSADGELVGLVFARAPGDGTVGYALTADAIAGTVAAAPGLTDDVPAGQCVLGG
ncbi:CvpA family protein [Micrococcus sp.]|uniref:CvpA family protein n=1 Tax=Micrococcus sp. TaxID=1271 RepID=UPI002A91CAD5|nr:CvpA family protein [Micrococcus sp.]MDY6055290.1 CvpA family protein [Micrococcus sp.]